MSKTWKVGPPPSLGWWPCRTVFTVDKPSKALRWWDGARWSVPVYPGEGGAVAPDVLNMCASMGTATDFNRIQYQARPDSWPESSKT